ncbi:MAG: SUMF1/EgtB/PvdO family nonheme iron enzyme, partial [Bacteroidetes bacterium]|nr:SUMF1/EgtB/PvdO family nonheme iron enzyme [Bacteroidota bacterium]
DTSIATVDANGLVTPLTGGAFTITISAPANASFLETSLTTDSITVNLNANLSSTVELEMLRVEPGTFTMGAPTSEFGLNKNGETQHQVTLSKAFYLSKLEVTQAQYETVMAGNSDGLSATPSSFSGGNRPVEQVSHDDIQIFLSRLNAQQSANIPAGWSYYLPTESQWEYACRAGTTTAYSWGNTLGDSNGLGT